MDDARSAVATSDGGEWRVVGNRGLSARIRGEILRYITEQDIKPGYRLPAERDLAALLDVSRPSMREAVRALEAEGILEVRHGTGVFVRSRHATNLVRPDFTIPEDLGELFDMREVLEVAAARWAAERQRPELAGVDDAFAALEAGIEAGPMDFDDLQRMDVTFHTRIVQSSGSKLLEQTQAVIYGLILEGMRSTLEVPGRLEKSRADHARILAALKAGDPDKAEAEVRAHIAGARAAAAANSEALTRDSGGLGATAARGS
jgi:GntR family transcriptional regulator, transcriptional repressor for pyruvate dehydrogenase complex